ncbi:hypothetical protein AJ79_09794 [Helicocarpus griseus UAMH5409]|uniref:Uncharacterized protein n=1 Tax=Helicocarpus griseus UAMH5409 TaxID=1447875 RepID=A0A2B7WHC3_9EURO|nr:hypothetical protein AJ79_09794 [Helicocarpus griseus UAMH5409]
MIARPSPTEEAPEARLFADPRATKALLKYIETVRALSSEWQAAESALQTDTWGIEALKEEECVGEG